MDRASGVTKGKVKVVLVEFIWASGVPKTKTKDLTGPRFQATNVMLCIVGSVFDSSVALGVFYGRITPPYSSRGM
jgi:hypothetical protein